MAIEILKPGFVRAIAASGDPRGKHHPESWWDYTLLPGLVPEQLWEHMRHEAERAVDAPI